MSNPKPTRGFHELNNNLNSAREAVRKATAALKHAHSQLQSVAEEVRDSTDFTWTARRQAGWDVTTAKDFIRDN